MISKYGLFSIIFILGLLSVKAEISHSSSKFKYENSSSRITLMTYNVENLFDTRDDPHKSDETYLPLHLKRKTPHIMKSCKRLKKSYWRNQCKNIDWTTQTLREKMKRLADVIRQVNSKKGPDILILQEVENQSVLEQLRTQFLADIFPFPSILIEGPDERGIDVGVLTRLRQKSSAQLHLLRFKPRGALKARHIHPTRGILEVPLELPDGSTLYVFGVHFPSQRAPTPVRQQALFQLKSIINKKPKDSLIVVGGDFNISSSEEAQRGLYKSLEKEYLVSHAIGCKDCRGTHYYHPKRSWSFLDAFIFSKTFDKTLLFKKPSSLKVQLPPSRWLLDPSSIRIFSQSIYQVNKWGSPSRFNMGKRKNGVSDHWPILAEIYKSSN